jgi:hypothetical protein
MKLKNIGVKCAEKLCEVGICTSEQLKELGAEEVFWRIFKKKDGKKECVLVSSMLLKALLQMNGGMKFQKKEKKS